MCRDEVYGKEGVETFARATLFKVSQESNITRHEISNYLSTLTHVPTKSLGLALACLQVFHTCALCSYILVLSLIHFHPFNSNTQSNDKGMYSYTFRIHPTHYLLMKGEKHELPLPGQI